MSKCTPVCITSDILEKNIPESSLLPPPDIVSVRIDADTGLIAKSNNQKTIFEVFRKRLAPIQRNDTKVEDNSSDPNNDNDIRELY